METLPAAPARVLLLDYDGPLAPFRLERDRATPYIGVRGATRFRRSPTNASELFQRRGEEEEV